MSILRNILSQILWVPRHDNHAIALERLEEKLRRDYFQRGMTLSWHDLRQYILEAASIHGEIIIVVDGFDECDEEARQQLLEHLFDLQRISNGRIRLFLSSRPLPDIEQCLNSAGILTVSLDDEVCSVNVAADIKTHIWAKLSKVAFTPSLKASIHDELMSSGPM